MKKYLIIILTFLTAFSFGQNGKENGAQLNLEKKYLQQLERNSISIADTSDLFMNDGTSKTLFYYALVPRNKIKGVLVMLAGTWEPIEYVINSNKKLLELACDSSLLVIIPSLNNNLYIDNFALNFLNTTFTDVLKKYSPPKNKFVIGGYSLGGMNSIRYTEMANDSKSTTTIKPLAVYGVDPPLDYVGMYLSFQRTIELNFSEPAVKEAKDYINKLNTQFGGAPDKNPDKYIQFSMYSRNQKDGGNAKYLKNVPIRIYSDPDIDWWMKNRHQDYYDMNAVEDAGMINQLNIMGNDKAEFINALGKGYRLEGNRHPHSWSIVEPHDCINWIMKLLK